LKYRTTGLPEAVRREDGIEDPTIGGPHKLGSIAITAEPAHPSDPTHKLDRVRGSDLPEHHLHRKREGAPLTALHDGER
jgi:hypothetical protein